MTKICRFGLPNIYCQLLFECKNNTCVVNTMINHKKKSVKYSDEYFVNLLNSMKGRLGSTLYGFRRRINLFGLPLKFPRNSHKSIDSSLAVIILESTIQTLSATIHYSSFLMVSTFNLKISKSQYMSTFKWSMCSTFFLYIQIWQSCSIR